MAKRLAKYTNCWLTRTDPSDVARVESKTVIVTEKKRDAVPEPLPGVEPQLNRWMSPDQHQQEKVCLPNITLVFLSLLSINVSSDFTIASILRVFTKCIFFKLAEQGVSKM